MVERFEMSGADLDWNASSDGEWVRYSDIATLEAQLAERAKVERAARALLNNLWGHVVSGAMTHVENWVAMERRHPGSRDLAEILSALEATPPAPKVTEESRPDDAVAELFVDAWAEAEKAMRKFPQPNYVISKVAEEAGEVVKAAIHCAEGRETAENVAAEIKQAMAMLIRLYVEGDQVHGLPPIAATLSGDAS